MSNCLDCLHITCINRDACSWFGDFQPVERPLSKYPLHEYFYTHIYYNLLMVHGHYFSHVGHWYTLKFLITFTIYILYPSINPSTDPFIHRSIRQKKINNQSTKQSINRTINQSFFSSFSFQWKDIGKSKPQWKIFTPDGTQSNQMRNKLFVKINS